ncbi:MAG TPA: hypothetical protein VHQ02_00210 [Usitatibacter sp.]|nr:hypothetical protein [Usitatibacter sp.]
MKRMLTLAASLLFVSGAAFANHCPKDMAEIDAALAKKPNLTAAQMTEVKALRKKGELEHKAGNHKESMEDLAKAKEILGLK